jgi:hypothetical protein
MPEYLVAAVRLQEGEITYRKHWLRLLETAGLQMGLVLLLFPVVFGWSCSRSRFSQQGSESLPMRRVCWGGGWSYGNMRTGERYLRSGQGSRH